MKKLVLLIFLLTGATAWAQTIGNYHVEAMKSRYQTRSSGAAILGKIPSKLLAKKYQQPTFKKWILPYKSWEKSYKKYFQSHYGDPSLTFRPELIVMHYTVTPSSTQVWNYFKRSRVSVQLMVDKDGTVYRLMPLTRKCTGAYGVNHKAISIEMIATTETDLLSRPKQLYSSFCVVRRLMDRYDIPAKKVIAHYEVSQGKRVVPEYLDLKDKVYPDRYPPSSARTDPGRTYMKWLRTWLRKHA